MRGANGGETRERRARVGSDRLSRARAHPVAKQDAVAALTRGAARENAR